MKKHLIGLVLMAAASGAWAAGNTTVDDFNQAKRLLERQVYTSNAERVTVYCEAKFDKRKQVRLPGGFKTEKHKKRAERVEWEHIVPAENFGRAFVEWREGHPDCVTKKGKTFKGRKCATQTNAMFRLMEADLYNLWPAIGAVNAMRSNYQFQMLDPATPSTFGTCEMKIVGKKVEPPANARGIIARTHQYMAEVYPAFRMSRQQSQLMAAWAKQYPVTKWECTRTKRIEKIQGNANEVVKDACIRAGLW